MLFSSSLLLLRFFLIEVDPTWNLGSGPGMEGSQQAAAHGTCRANSSPLQQTSFHHGRRKIQNPPIDLQPTSSSIFTHSTHRHRLPTRPCHPSPASTPRRVPCRPSPVPLRKSRHCASSCPLPGVAAAAGALQATERSPNGPCDHPKRPQRNPPTASAESGTRLSSPHFSCPSSVDSRPLTAQKALS